MAPEFFIPLVVMAAPVLIVVMTLQYRYRQTKTRYATLLQLAEKGVALPANLLAEPHAPDSDRRRGLVLVAAGVGLIAMFLTLPYQIDNGEGVAGLWGTGLLPLMTGLGYLASWRLNQGGAGRAG